LSGGTQNKYNDETEEEIVLRGFDHLSYSNEKLT
jgi:hypothetical protein